MNLPDIPQYKVLPYDHASFDKVKSLFALAFNGRQINEDSWKWQFYDNPCKNQCVTTLWDDDTLVALTGLTPTFCHLNGKPCISACSGTTMARPDYLGVSIQLYRECANNNRDIDLIYGFPNKNSYPITKFIGHHYVGDICFWYMSPCKCQFNEDIKKIDSFKDVHGKLYETLIEKCSYIRDRTADYLNWRFVKRPGVNYRIVEYHNADGVLGYMVYNYYKEEGELHLQIVDIVAQQDMVFEELIKYAISAAYDTNADMVKIWMTYKKYADYLNGLGFQYGLHPFKCTIWDRDLAIENCYFTMSDSDIF